ncbi:MAG TPA: hypothetical protein VJZ49_10450 [Syntrophales bacterium]|nr:hypothetical protein [Syntrophales bacterium]
MNKYSIISLYQKRSQSFVKRILALLKRMELDKSFSKELSDFQKELLQVGGKQ